MPHGWALNASAAQERRLGTLTDEVWENMTHWKGVPALTWLLLGFAFLTLLVGIGAMRLVDEHVSGEAIAVFVTAVFAVVAHHIGHVSGHQLAVGDDHQSQ